MKRIVVLWAFFLGLLSLAQAQGVAVYAALSLEQDRLLPDEIRHLKLSLENRSGQDLKIGTTRDWLSFIILGDKNRVVAPVGTNDVPTGGLKTVPTGETATSDFNLTPYFDFRQPGQYTVKATIKLPQWQEEITTDPVSFTIVNGIPLANMPVLEVGVPYVRSGEPAMIHRFRLEKSDSPSGAKLYVRVTDRSGSQTWRLTQLGAYFAYSDPDVKLDRYNVLHVLHQTNAKLFTYCAVDTLGRILVRQTFQYTTQRPVLVSDANGDVQIAGGTRVPSENDLPPTGTKQTAPALNTGFPGSKLTN